MNELSDYEYKQIQLEKDFEDEKEKMRHYLRTKIHPLFLDTFIKMIWCVKMDAEDYKLYDKIVEELPLDELDILCMFDDFEGFKVMMKDEPDYE